VSADTFFFVVFYFFNFCGFIFYFLIFVGLRGRQAEQVSGLSSEEVPGLVVEAVGAKNLKKPVEVVRRRLRWGLLDTLHVSGDRHGWRRSVRHDRITLRVDSRKPVESALSTYEVFMRFVNLVEVRLDLDGAFAVAVAVAAVVGRVLVVGDDHGGGRAAGRHGSVFNRYERVKGSQPFQFFIEPLHQ